MTTLGLIRSDSEALPHSKPKALDGAGHVVLGGGGEGGAEEEAAWGYVLLGAEPGAADGEDALFDAGVEDRLLDLENGLRGGFGVFCVVYFKPELW